MKKSKQSGIDDIDRQQTKLYMTMTQTLQQEQMEFEE